jgi:hypothetical protein
VLYQGKAVTDCPLCQKPVSYQGGTLSIPTGNLPLLRRQATKAARWAQNNGTTLARYTLGVSAGQQYLGYFPAEEIQQADALAQGAP